MTQTNLINFWISQCQNLYALAAEDAEVCNGGPYVSRQIVKEKIENLLIRYAMIANNFREIADAIKTPILTHFIRKIYELTVSRRLQLQHELIRLLHEKFFNVDNLLIFNNITPYDIQLKLPYYLKREGLQRKKNIDGWFEDYLNSIEDMEEEDSESTETEKEEVEIEEHQVETEEQQEEDEESVEPEETILSHLEKDVIAREKNYDVQKMLKEKYREMILQTIEKFKNKYGRIIEENIEDEIIEWIEFFFAKTGQLPAFPSDKLVFATGEIFGAPKSISKELKSKMSAPPDIPANAYSKEFSELPKFQGSQLIVTNHWIHPDDWLLAKNAKQNKGKKNEKSKEKKKKKKDKNKNKAFELESTDYFSILNILKVKLMETCDIDGDVELNAMVEVGLEIRSAVDELMREELKKKSKKKKKSNKKRGKKKGKKGALPVGEEVKEELAGYGVFKQGNNTNLYDHFGQFTSEIRAKFDGELLDFLHHRCILPLSSNAIHNFTPLTRSMCLLGQQNCGKEQLLDALVTETGSALFDLSPAVTAHIFPGKKGIKTLVSLVGRLARQLQPSIIFIGDVDKILSKKVAKADKILQPRRLTGILPKLIKSIKKSDRILIVGTATEPWLAKGKKINKSFDTFLYIPSSNYDTHLLAWQNLVEFDLKTITALAKTSSKEKYACHNLEETTMNSQLAENMVDNLPINQLELQGKFNKFLDKTPLEKKKKKEQEQEITKKTKKR